MAGLVLLRCGELGYNQPALSGSVRGLQKELKGSVKVELNA
jgi:hypothetical protein